MSTTTPFRPVERRRAFEDVVVQIEEAIAAGQLQAGDRLPSERELAEIFEVSRNSVREALRILEAFGVIAARQGRGPDAGSVITAVERNGLPGMLRLYATVLRIPLHDLVDIRVALEAMNARAAAAHGDAEHLAELARNMAPEHDKDRFLALDTEFHVAIARASGNSLAPLLMEALRESIGRAMRTGFDTLDDWEGTRDRVAAEHAEIAAVIAGGDGDAAADAVERHVRNFYRLLLEDQDRG
jgi:GntR family transcriptional regulator, transcriptional repressor for pyruvate dehydrogenase complex